MRLGRILGGVGLAVAGIGAVLVFREPAARSADHLDSPATKADHTVDINDLYSWVDGNNAVFVMTSDFTTTPTTKFSDKVQYVFHTSSGPAYGAATTPYDIIVTFDAANVISAWYGTDGFVTGDASKEAGLVSTDAKFKIFAGPRSDPFFFNLNGFKAAIGAVEGAIPTLLDAGTCANAQAKGCINAGGCPQLDIGTAGAVGGLLKAGNPDGGGPVDFFANLNALAIVVSIDKALITKGGPIVATWASTNKKP
jgi:Domain of unknown function (DUF4331)